ncbi:MAG: hypothetical protein EP347_01070 [Alphaproteobacteria bacterium]|nr:MAG: hypothetical protein EP347_01070 [Alphaproteobacteria bacterium]
MTYKTSQLARTSALALFLALGAAPVSAQDTGIETAGCPSVLPDTEIDITADQSEFRQQEKLVFLKGSVDVTQGPLRVRADAIKLSYEPSGNEAADPQYKGVVTSLLATGNVRIDCNGERATGASAEYNVPQRKIELTGDVMLSREGNLLAGDRLHIDLNTGASRIFGSRAVTGQSDDGRIRAIFKSGTTDKKDEAETD